MKILIPTVAAFAAFSTPAVAGPIQAPRPHAKGAAKAASVICPVTGTRISSSAKAYNKETYKGKTYYFCCAECKPRFDKNRDGIIAHAAHDKYEKM